MREHYCIHTIEKIRPRPIIQMTKQQEIFCVLYPFICMTQRVDGVSKVMPKIMKTVHLSYLTIKPV